MSIKKVSQNNYLVDVRSSGRNGKRYRKKFDTKTEVQAYEKYILAQHHNKEWVDRPKDTRNISELIPLWWLHHGSQLKDGDNDLKRVNSVNELLGNPRVCDITPRFIADFAAMRLQNIKATTYNRDISVLSSVFTQLIKSEIVYGENPFKGKKQKEKRIELSFLTAEQIRLLLNVLDDDALLIAKVCLSRGARWGEGMGLQATDVHDQKITFPDTKNSKSRTVPISRDLFEELRVWKQSGRLFRDCYKQLRYRLKARCGFELSKGQASHVLRHTFASHFMMNDANLLVLQKILGHSDIKMTMRYAHLAPDYLTEAVDKNPLSQMKKVSTVRPH